MGKKVLVIDDDESVRDAFCMALEDEDCDLDIAEDGKKGLQMASEGKYDLIFLDFKMPELKIGRAHV